MSSEHADANHELASTIEAFRDDREEHLETYESETARIGLRFGELARQLRERYLSPAQCGDAILNAMKCLRNIKIDPEK